jgi:pyruvate,water dikinase
MDSWLIDTVPSSRLPVYTRFNANDVLPGPITPLGATLAWNPHIFAGFSLGYAEMGAVTLAEAAEDEVWPGGGFFYGHLYVNVTMARLTGLRAGMGWEPIDEAFFGSHPDAPPHAPRPEDGDPQAAAAIAARTQWTLSTTTFPELEEDRATAQALRDNRPDLRALSSAALVARARSMMPYEQLMWRGELIAGAQAAVGPAVVSQAVAGVPDARVLDLIGTSGDVDSAAPSFAMWDLSRLVRADAQLSAAFAAGLAGLSERVAGHAGFAAALERFLYDYGYRGPSEWDLGADSWETRPELVLALVDRLRLLDDDASPTERGRAQAATTASAVAAIEAELAGNADALGMLAVGLASARRFAGWRERGKSNCIRVLHEARVALAELGRRLEADGRLPDAKLVFMALETELDTLVLNPQSLVSTLLARREQWRELADLELPLFVSGDRAMTPLSALPRKTRPAVAPQATGSVLTGQPASAGVARGRVRVVHDPASVADFEPGDILVAPQTDPSWTPLFMVASAVVVGVGAMMSHAMIVSRELGIPCVAGIENVTTLIADGALVEIDGAAGTVTILQPAVASRSAAVPAS